MPNSFLITAPGGGTSVEIASFVQANPGPDFGAKGVLDPKYGDSPYSEGVLLAETAGVRQMVFPLLLGASRSIANLGLYDAEALLRRIARPGAVIDLKPEGATTAVRFDVLHGRYEQKFETNMNRQGWRYADLILGVEPFGYWPTWIIAASVASVALPGVVPLTFPVVGDAPGFAVLTIGPTVATSYGAGSWLPDMLGWGLGAKPSFSGVWPAASIASAVVATLQGYPFAPGSQTLDAYLSPTQGGWTTMAIATIGEAIEPAYRGRFRVFAHMTVAPSQAFPWMVSLDAANQRARALASAAPIATVAPGVASGTPGNWAQGSPALAFVDLGEITLPPGASGLPQSYLLRLWTNPPTSNVGIATPIVSLGGFRLLPLDDSSGILPRGLAQPTVRGAGTVARLSVDANARVAQLGLPAPDLSTVNPLADALAYYRGGFPLVLPSTFQLDLVGAARRVDIAAAQPTYPQIIGSQGPKAFYRFDTETVGPTVLDTMGSWAGSYSAVVPTLSAPGAVGSAAQLHGLGTDFMGFASLFSFGVGATSWSVKMWVRRTGNAGVANMLLSQGPANGGGSSMRLFYGNTDNLQFDFGGAALDVTLAAAGPYPAVEASYHQLAITWDYATRTRAIWRDAALIASAIAAGTYQASGPILFGKDTAGAFPAHVAVDELTFYRGTAIGSDILIQDLGLVANGVGAQGAHPTFPAVRSAPLYAAVGVRYQPRFQFLKGL